jgi:hypothetical protein
MQVFRAFNRNSRTLPAKVFVYTLKGMAAGLQTRAAAVPRLLISVAPCVLNVLKLLSSGMPSPNAGIFRALPC